jgi:hypothetical protein
MDEMMPKPDHPPPLKSVKAANPSMKEPDNISAPTSVVVPGSAPEVSIRYSSLRRRLLASKIPAPTFRPYDPPAHHPDHSHYHAEWEQAQYSSVQEGPSESQYRRSQQTKTDPYDEGTFLCLCMYGCIRALIYGNTDDVAQQILKTEPSPTPVPHIKAEPVNQQVLNGSKPLL